MNSFFSAHLRSVERVSPSIIRAKFSGGNLAGFATTGQADEWVRLVFPDRSGAIAMPSAKERRQDGLVSRSATRPYTVRAFDAETATLTIDFVVHDHGVATNWILNAAIGDEIGITPPDARYTVNAEAQWILLLSDVTGLPAVGRILEQDVSGIPIYVHVEVPYQEDRRNIIGTGIEIRWHVGFGGNAAPSRLAAIAREILAPATPGYVWIAGEAQEIYDARAYFRDVRGIPATQITAIGYWFRGKTRD